MKKKSSKLARLERNRFSIFTNDLKHCYFDGKEDVDLHEIFGGCRRIVSMQYGLVLPVCRYHHTLIENDEKAKLYWKQIAEKKWLEVYEPFTKEDFIKIFGKNYI